MEPSWKKAIIRVLGESSEPLHYREICEQALSRGYYKTDGATPADSVNACITTSIKHDGEKSPFCRVGKGVFMLREKTTGPAETATSTGRKPEPFAESDDAPASIIHSFGMYWQRDRVIWRGTPRIYGQQHGRSGQVDFSPQQGIYILYDHHVPVYVGRSIDRPLGKRLYEHTIDRLGSRWNQFSWFGLLDVSQEGRFREADLDTSRDTLVATLEALLIETLEPPQNRKRGDDFSTVEYIQGTDPELKKQELQEFVQALTQEAEK